MFDQFTPEAQSAVVAAQEIARQQGYAEIQLVHLQAAADGVAPTNHQVEHAVLDRLGLSDVDHHLAEAPPPVPFNHEVKGVLVEALRLAGEDPVGVEQLLAALARS